MESAQHAEYVVVIEVLAIVATIINSVNRKWLGTAYFAEILTNFMLCMIDTPIYGCKCIITPTCGGRRIKIRHFSGTYINTSDLRVGVESLITL